MIKVTFPKPVKPDVVIEMPYEVAQTILRVCHRISGDTESSRRRHTDQLRRALINAGIEDCPDTDASGDIHFR